MITFLVEDMSCAHCEATLRRALSALDPAAEVRVDLARHQVQMASAQVDCKQVEDAIRAAGYTPVAA